MERDGSPVERLRTLVLGMLERIDDNPAFFRLTLATQGVASQVASTVGAELDVIGLDIAGLIRDVIEQGTRWGTSDSSTPTRRRRSWDSSCTGPCRSRR